MDKQYTIEEVEAMIEEPPCSNCKGSGLVNIGSRRKHCRVCGGTGREDHLYGEERIIIRQLLARVKEYDEAVKAIEERYLYIVDLNGHSRNSRAFDILADACIKLGDIQKPSALQSLIKE